jgi:protein gp37
MARASNIEWTDMTWNPVTGCTKVSAGCKHCYAEAMAKRLQAMGCDRYSGGFKLRIHDDLVTLPLKWKMPRRVFVNSMSDLFHPDVPLEFLQRVFQTMNATPRHQFQVLTKRPERLVEVAGLLTWTDNIWMGVTVENQRYAFRSEMLSTVPAAIRFISAEPLIGSIQELPLDGIHWVIVGGESGPKARPMKEHWAIGVYEQCRAADVAFFFKQWGGVQKHRNGREFLGRTFDEYPSPLSGQMRLTVTA